MGIKNSILMSILTFVIVSSNNSYSMFSSIKRALPKLQQMASRAALKSIKVAQKHPIKTFVGFTVAYNYCKNYNKNLYLFDNVKPTEIAPISDTVTQFVDQDFDLRKSQSYQHICALLNFEDDFSDPVEQLKYYRQNIRIALEKYYKKCLWSIKFNQKTINQLTDAIVVFSIIEAQYADTHYAFYHGTTQIKEIIDRTIRYSQESNESISNFLYLRDRGVNNDLENVEDYKEYIESFDPTSSHRLTKLNIDFSKLSEKEFDEFLDQHLCIGDVLKIYDINGKFIWNIVYERQDLKSIDKINHWMRMKQLFSSGHPFGNSIPKPSPDQYDQHPVVRRNFLSVNMAAMGNSDGHITGAYNGENSLLFITPGSTRDGVELQRATGFSGVSFLSFVDDLTILIQDLIMGTSVLDSQHGGLVQILVPKNSKSVLNSDSFGRISNSKHINKQWLRDNAQARIALVPSIYENPQSGVAMNYIVFGSKSSVKKIFDGDRREGPFFIL